MNLEKPRLYIPRTVHQKLMHWIKKAPGEVGGMGTISYEKNGHFFWVRDVYLVEQEVTSGTTELNEIALGKLEYELEKNKVKGKLNYWWHSHSNFGVFWSKDDRDTINQMGSRGYLVATVFNKKNEMRSAVCAKAKTPYGSTLAFEDDIYTEIFDEHPGDDVIASWDKDFEEKVKEKVVVRKEEDREPFFRRFNIDSSIWKTPTAEIMRERLNTWRKYIPEMGIDPKEREHVVSAAAAQVHPKTLDHMYFEMTREELEALEAHYLEFEINNPSFDWIGDVRQ